MTSLDTVRRSFRKESYAARQRSFLVSSIVPTSGFLQSISGGFWFDVTEAIRERRGSSVQLSKDSFDSAPISVATYLKSEANSLQCSLEVFRAVNKKDGSFEIVFLSQFAEKYLGDEGCHRRKQSDVKQLIHSWISSSVQPELLIVNPNHCLVNGGLIRRLFYPDSSPQHPAPVQYPNPFTLLDSGESLESADLIRYNEGVETGNSGCFMLSRVL